MNVFGHNDTQASGSTWLHLTNHMGGILQDCITCRWEKHNLNALTFAKIDWMIWNKETDRDWRQH